jgi:hypothetical protein
MHLFEKLLSVSIEEIELELRCCKAIPWMNFLLNPRRLRGSDFLMRWSQGYGVNIASLMLSMQRKIFMPSLMAQVVSLRMMMSEHSNSILRG